MGGNDDVLARVINLLQRDANGKFKDESSYVSKEELVDNVVDQSNKLDDEESLILYHYNDHEKKFYGIKEDFGYTKKN